MTQGPKVSSAKLNNSTGEEVKNPQEGRADTVTLGTLYLRQENIQRPPHWHTGDNI